MKIHISDIHEGGLAVSADSSKDPWLKNIFMEVFGPDKIKEDDGGRIDIQLFKDGRNVTIIGGAVLKFHPFCDRCLVSFQKQEQVPIHQIMSPFKETPEKKDEPCAEDEDVGYYKNDEIELADIIKEYIILAQGMKNLCTSDCKGLCPKCGKNLNNGTCRCKKVDKSKKSPFAVLKKIRT